LKKARKRKGSGEENEGEDMDNADLEEIEELPRPMGQKKLKERLLKRKLKMPTKKKLKVQILRR
jgi:hypothetical protein